jgi:hypothetical protein
MRHVATVHEGVSKSFRTESITKYTLTFGITRWEATQRVMAAKLTRLNHKIAIQLHLVAESYTICSSRSGRPVRKLLDTHSYCSGWKFSGNWVRSRVYSSWGEWSGSEKRSQADGVALAHECRPQLLGNTTFISVSLDFVTVYKWCTAANLRSYF